MEAANLTVSINGDASGLMSAVSSANAGIGLLKSSADAALASLSDKTVSIKAVNNTAAGIAAARAALNSLQSKTVTVSVNYKTASRAFAKGTQNAPAGLALINDEEGTGDPRELVYHKGRYMMYGGRNVVVPLDSGDRVYTASQTKAIMAGLGIPNYASGLNNELFETERGDFKSRVSSSNVSIEEQIAWWNAAAERYVDDYEVIKECGEEVFSLTRKLVDSLNDASEAYIDERNYFNDWEDYGDSAVDAFERIKERNREFLDSGVITREEYSDNVSEAGEQLYEGRIEQSEKWLKHERNYNDLSVEDTIAAYERMEAYTVDYYNRGLINYKTYADAMLELSENRADAEQELLKQRQVENEKLYSDWQTSAENWYTLRDTYGDWENYGDSEVEYYERCIERVREFYEQGVIDWQTYSDETMSYSLKLYRSQEDALDALLDKQADYISEMKTRFSNEESALSESWEVEDRAESIDDVKAEMALYENAVTAKGQEKYKELQDELESLEREEELYELEKEHQAALEELQAAYDEAEADKEKALWAIRDYGIDISDICDRIEASSEDYRSRALTLLEDIVSAVSQVSVSVYNDNSTVNTSDVSSAAQRKYTISAGYYG